MCFCSVGRRDRCVLLIPLPLLLFSCSAHSATFVRLCDAESVMEREQQVRAQLCRLQPLLLVLLTVLVAPTKQLTSRSEVCECHCDCQTHSCTSTTCSCSWPRHHLIHLTSLTIHSAIAIASCTASASVCPNESESTL
jgi:hypothetical protein